MLKCVGIGVGPANLSLACLLSPSAIPALFFDSKRQFSWHDGMQIPGATLQVSLFKDLVTLSDPQNPYSFISYLFQTGRLYHFLNAQFSSVTRREFAAYMAWASARNDSVCFDEKVLRVTFDGAFHIETTKRTVQAENLSIGVGKSQWLPECASHQQSDTLFHSGNFMAQGQSLGGKRVAVVGGGQSGAEVFLDLISRTGGAAPAEIAWISSRKNFFPIDDSPFTNDMFMPCHVNVFASLLPAQRERYLADHLLASDGISMATLQAIYQRLYSRRFVEGQPENTLLWPGRRVRAVAHDAGGWMLLTRQETGFEETLRTDTVIFATGYRNQSMPFLTELRHRLQVDHDEIVVDDDYAALWNGPPGRHIFVQNAALRQKGLADPNLSLLAWRSQRIVDRIIGQNAARMPLPSMVDWAGGVPDVRLRTA